MTPYSFIRRVLPLVVGASLFVNAAKAKENSEVPRITGNDLAAVETALHSEKYAEALLILGRAKYEAGQYDAALGTFRRVYELPAKKVNLSRAHLAAGWSLWKLHRPEEVATEVQPITKNAESGAEFHYLIGVAAYSMKDWAVAVEELSRAADESSVHRAPALFYLGECYLQSSGHKEARGTFQRLVDAEPASDWADDAVWGLVRTARAAKLPLEQQAAIDLLTERYPASEYVAQISLLESGNDSIPLETSPGFDLFEEAVGHERDGHFDAALSAYHEFLETDSTNTLRAEGMWRTARLHDRLKQHAEATDLYSRLLADFPEFDRAGEVLASLARIADKDGKSSQAANHYHTLLERFPESPQAAEAAYWLALVAADEKRSGEAQEHVDWLLERLDKSRSRDLWQQTLGLECQLFASANQWQSIVELLDTHLSDVGAGASASRLAFWRAEAAIRTGDVSDAGERFDALVVKTVGINESWVPMVPLRRAQIAARREDWQQVLKLVKELDQRHPEFELGYECDYLRGRAHAGLGEMSAARKAYGDVLENEWAAGTETAAMAQWMIGETYFHQRNYELAGVAYRRVIERHKFPEWQARAALQAGKCAELSDNWSEAAELYADALERWQGSTSTKELNARLQWVQEQVAQREAVLRR